MKIIKPFKLPLLSLILLAAFAFSGSAVQVFAHGGEDHGEAKPKTETNDKGTVLHTTRVGDLEVMLKHERLIPDAGNAARLFVTEYENNTGAEGVVPVIEIEAANGAVTQATIEKTDTTGSFTAKFSALPAGTYLIRAKLTHDGETDTATFSGVTIENAPTASAAGSGSWTQTAVTALLFAVALALFGGLIYRAARAVRNKPLREETVSA